MQDKYEDQTGEGRWVKEDNPGWRRSVGIDGDSLLLDVTAEDAAKFVAGELDYCHECEKLVAPFEGERCAECTPVLSHAEQDARDTGLPLSWFSHQSATHDHDGNPRRWRR